MLELCGSESSRNDGIWYGFFAGEYSEELELQTGNDTDLDDRTVDDSSPAVGDLAVKAENGLSKQVDTPISATVATPLANGNGVAIQSSDAAKAAIDAEFSSLCEAFPDYSEDLLRSMLVSIKYLFKFDSCLNVWSSCHWFKYYQVKLFVMLPY